MGGQGEDDGLSGFEMTAVVECLPKSLFVQGAMQRSGEVFFGLTLARHGGGSRLLAKCLRSGKQCACPG